MPFEDDHSVGGKQLVCRYWTGNVGSCRNGAACSFSHNAMKTCRAWTGIPGSCRFGNQCRYLHAEELPAETTTQIVENKEDEEAANPGHLNPFAAEFIPMAVSHGYSEVDEVNLTCSSSSEAMPVPLFVPAQPHDGSEQSYVSVPVPHFSAHALRLNIKQIQRDCEVGICYDPHSQTAIVTGTAAQQKCACAAIAAVLAEAEKRNSAECCVCMEAPRNSSSSGGRPARYGLLEGCDHIVCMGCVMTWRQNEDMTREARLGCPLCRAISHIIVPWPEAVAGEERLQIIAQYKERCRSTPCKWSAQRKRCPAGKHCIYDHSSAPQVVEPHRCRRRRPEFDLLEPFEFAMSLSRLQSADDDSSDDELGVDDLAHDDLLRVDMVDDELLSALLEAFSVETPFERRRRLRVIFTSAFGLP